MPTREEMIQALKTGKRPSREEMISKLSTPPKQLPEQVSDGQGAPDEPSTFDKVKAYGGQALHKVGQALDYAGGVARTGAAAPFMESVNLEDVKNAFKGQPLSGTEILNRGGVPQGKSLSDVLPGAYSPTGDEWLKLQKGGWADPTARGAAGFGLEVAADPLTYLTLGTGSAAKQALLRGDKINALQQMARLATPASTLTENAGKNIYESALKNIDKNLTGVKIGKAPLAPQLLEAGAMGNMKNLSEASEKLRMGAGDTLGEITKALEAKGHTIDTFNATKPAYEYVQKLKQHSRDPRIAAEADRYQGLLDNIQGISETGTKEMQAMKPTQAAEFATLESKQASKKAFSPAGGSEASHEDAFDRALAQGFRSEIEKGVKQELPQLAPEFKQAKKVYASTKEARPMFQTEINKEITKNPFTQIDAALAAGGAGTMLHNPQAGSAILATLAGKQLMKGLNSTAGRTSIGNALYKGAPLASPLSTRMLRPKTPWELMMEQQNQGE